VLNSELRIQLVTEIFWTDSLQNIGEDNYYKTSTTEKGCL